MVFQTMRLLDQLYDLESWLQETLIDGDMSKCPVMNCIYSQLKLMQQLHYSL